MRIIGTPLLTTNFKDASTVKTLITRKLQNAKVAQLGTKNTDIQRFEELYNKLKRKDVNLSKQLYMLYKISNIQQDSNSVELFQPILPTVDDENNENDDSMDIDEAQIDYEQSDRKLGNTQFLQSFRYRSNDISEEALYKDLLYVFQGIDGQHISFSILEDAFVLSENVNVSPSIRKNIQEMCELGWLFKKVDDFLKRNIDSSY